MAEHEADRDESRDPEKSEASGDDGLPVDEDAAWQAIVAGYGEEPADPPGAKPFKSVEDLALLESETNGPAGGPTQGGLTKDAPGKDSTGPDRDAGSDAESDAKNAKPDAKNAERDAKPGGEPGAGKPLGSSVSFAPGVGGPRDYTTPEPSEDDFDADDEGHFVPPEPPPLPEADVTAKFAWLAVLGGPLLILLAVLFGWQMTWWLTTLGVGGFLGGFATLVTRMHSGDDDEDDDPGRGAVV
ncbi:hypothetical protein [Streptomyces sp. NPDC003032]